MKTAYIDCTAGVSGDMLLGALIDLGESGAARGKGFAASIARDLRRLRLPAWSWRMSLVRRCGFRARRVEVLPSTAAGVHKVRILGGLAVRARRAGFPPSVADRGAAIVARILHAESVVHGRRLAHVHLHELEDVDTAVDVFGTLLAVDRLGIERVFASAVSVGEGSVKAAHGRLPVPAPATAELLRGRVVRFGGETGELATPTGAALVSEIAEDGPAPAILVEGVGCGAGSRDTEGHPNILRVFLGSIHGGAMDGVGAEAPATAGQVRQLDAVVDDMNPQIVQSFLERVYRDGALEAWTTPVGMKRNRPGIGLTVLAPAARLETMVKAFLEETGTLGVRISSPARVILERRIVRLRTRWGPLSFKVAGEGRSFHAIPEWREVRELAARRGVPARLVLEEARGLWGRLGGPKR